MQIEEVLEILENYKLRIPPTVYYELKADIVNFEDSEKSNWNYCGYIDNPPKEQDEYLVTWTGYLGDKLTKPFVAILEYNDEWVTKPIEDMGYRCVIIHAWMPLPKAYGGQDEQTTSKES